MCRMIWKRSLVPWTLVISSGGWFQSQKTLMAAAQSASDFSFEWWRGRRARQQEHKAALCFALHRTATLVTFTNCIHSKSWPKGHDLPWLPGPVLLKLQDGKQTSRKIAGRTVTLLPCEILFQPHWEEPSTAIRWLINMMIDALKKKNLTTHSSWL